MSTAGPNSPSSASGWSSSSNVYSSDNTYAAAAADSGSVTATLKVQGFGFAISSGATVDGITVVIERKAEIVSAFKDYTIQLLNGSGTGVGSNKKDTSIYWPTSDTNKTYGSSSDTWSASLTDTDVNSSSFGVQINAYNYAGATRSVYVDYVSITVDYTDASGQPMQARSRLVPGVRQRGIVGGW